MTKHRERFVWVRRRSRKNGRRHVEMICGLKNYALAAQVARGLQLLDGDHVYSFSERTPTAHKSTDFFVDESEDFDVQAFLTKFHPAAS